MKKPKSEIAKDPRQQLLDIYREIEDRTEALHNETISVVSLYFEAGLKLTEIWMKSPSKTKKEELYLELGLPERHATNSIKIYNYFKDKRESIHGMSLAKALKAIAACTQEKKALSERRSYNLGAAEEQMEFSWEDAFEQAPLAKVKLDNYRLESLNDQEQSFWLVQRGVDVPVKVVDIFIPKPENPALKLMHENMHKDIQKAVEKYYSHVEKDQEKEGNHAETN